AGSMPLAVPLASSLSDLAGAMSIQVGKSTDEAALEQIADAARAAPWKKHGIHPVMALAVSPSLAMSASDASELNASQPLQATLAGSAALAMSARAALTALAV